MHSDDYLFDQHILLNCIILPLTKGLNRILNDFFSIVSFLSVDDIDVNTFQKTLKILSSIGERNRTTTKM